MNDCDRLVDILKLCNLFYRNGLLSYSLYAILKDDLLSNETFANDQITRICSRYELDVLSDPQNLSTLLTLHEEMESFALSRAKLAMELFFNDNSLQLAHEKASSGSLELVSLSASSSSPEHDSRCLIYGEIEFDGFTELLKIATTGMTRKSKFVDLGSGVCKALLWTSIVSTFDLLVGIELNPHLFRLQGEIFTAFQAKMLSSIFTTKHQQETKQPKVELFLGSFLDPDCHDWTDADLVFANSAAFTEDLMASLATAAIGMRIGSRFITLSTPLPDSTRWSVVFKERVPMSWGSALAFVQERVKPANISHEKTHRGSQKQVADDHEWVLV